MNIFSFAKQIHLDGTNGKAILLMHGWSGTPDDMRFLAEQLNEAGYTVRVPRLTGHGTNAEDFVKANWNNWLMDAEGAYHALVAEFRTENVYVAGLSMGGCLATILARKNPNIPKVALFAPAFIAKDRMVYLTPLLSLFTKSLKKDTRKTSPDPERQEFLDAYENVTWVEPSADLLYLQVRSRWSLDFLSMATSVRVWIAKNDEALDVPKTVEYIQNRVKHVKIVVKEDGQHVIVNFNQKQAIADEVVAFFK